MSVADLRFAQYNIHGCESQEFVLGYVITEIVHYAFVARSEPRVSEVTYTHSQERWHCNSDIVSAW
jgi:hypothetical protein